MKLKHLFSLIVLLLFVLPNVYSQCLVEVSSQDGAINVFNLQQDANAKLFDENIQVVWGCDPWNGSPCTESEQITGLNTGATYFLSVESSTCSEWIPVIVNGAGPTPTCTDGIQNQGETDIDCGGPCEPCVVSECSVNIISENGNILVTGLSADANTKLFDENINAVWECNPWNGAPCSSSEVITGLTTGATYFLSVQSDVCAEWIAVVVEGDSGCPDADADGICDDEDCAPENPTLPEEPGVPCDDFNDLTENDVILADGCTCAGMVIEEVECNVSIASEDGAAIVTGLLSDANTKLFDSDFNVAWSCDPWNGNPCSSLETITGLSIGGTYYLSVQSNSCDLWLPVTIVGGDDGNECSELLGSFQNPDCIEFLENGSVRFFEEAGFGQHNRLWYDEFGQFISSTPVTLANTLGIENGRIIERNSFGNEVKNIPLDPALLSMYQNGGELASIARAGSNRYVIAGGVPEGGAGNDPYFDLLYVHLVDANGNLMGSDVFEEILYTEQDYQIYGNSFYEIEGVIPISQGVDNPVAYEIYVKKYPSGIITDFRESITRYDLSADFAFINSTVLKSNTGSSKWINIEIEADLCDEDRYQITCITDDLDTGVKETVVERIDHGYFAPFLRSRITTTNEPELKTYLLETNNLFEGIAQVFRAGSPNEPLAPGEFSYGISIDGVVNVEGTIFLNELPVSVFKNFDGSFNFVTESNGSLTMYTTNCEEGMPEDNLQNVEAEIAENSYTLNELFPNPATDEVILKVESLVNSAAQIFIHDMTGRKVFAKNIEMEIGINSFELNTNELKTGIYNVTLMSKNQVETTRFVKK